MPTWTDTGIEGASRLSEDSVNAKYDPVDAQSDTGYRRPPRISGCVLDYFFLLASIEDGGDFARSEMELMLNDSTTFFRPDDAILRLHKAIARSNAIYISDADWEYKYDRIFDLHGVVGPLLDECGLKLDYCDPDADYKDDVEAYMKALLELDANIAKEIALV